MYKEPKTSTIGTIVRFALFIIVVLAIVWIVVWFFFLRDNNPTDTAQKSPSKSSTSRAQPNTSSSKPNNVSSTSSSSQPAPTSDNSAATALPSTGTGNIIPLAIASGGVGSIAYYVRLRYKTVKETA